MENSKIAWTTHTFNPFIGCTKVSPGCDHCYAETWNARFGGGVAPNWGPGAPRRRTTVQNWNKPLKWQRERRAAIDAGLNPEPVRVFCASLADVFDNEVPDEWRRDLFALIERCPDLEWQIVTKRVGNVAKMVSPKWTEGRVRGLPGNVILISTIVNQDEADRDLMKLVSLKAVGAVSHIGVSYEPALWFVDWLPWIQKGPNPLDWVIIGGESDQGGAKGRPFYVQWARKTIEDCVKAKVPVFMKQFGSNPIDDLGRPFKLKDKAGADPDEWPEVMRVRQFPVML